MTTKPTVPSATRAHAAGRQVPLPDPVRPGRRPIFLIAEEVGGVPDEGYRVFTRQVARILARHQPVQIYTAGREAGEGMRLLPPRIRMLASPMLWRDLRASRPETIAYVYVATPPALLRARLLKLLSGKAQVVVVALQPVRWRGIGRLLVRWLWPDLLLVASKAEEDQATRLGARAARYFSGVDVYRFRPAQAGEREALRRKWSLPLETRVVLHVGHLLPSRNLKALVPLARKPGTTVIVVVTRERDADSTRLNRELQQEGIIVLAGYQPQIEEIYRLADCYVFPVQEGPKSAIAFPLSVLEALASDLPVVSTRFGVLPEHFADVEGVRFAGSDEELVTATEDLLTRRPSTRHLAEQYSWEAAVERIQAQIEHGHRGARRGRSRPQPWDLLSALLRRSLPQVEERLRSVLWGKRLGFELLPAPPASAVTYPPASAPVPTASASLAPRVASLVMVAADPIIRAQSALVHAARFYGVRAVATTPGDATGLLDQMTEEGWPLLGISLRGVPALPAGWPARLRRYLEAGHTIFLTDVEPESAPVLEELGRALDITLPACRRLARQVHPVRFAAGHNGLAREFAGVQIEACESEAAFTQTAGAEAVAALAADDESAPVVVSVPAQAGRVVLAAGRTQILTSLADAYGPRQALAVLPPMMLIRQLYGEAVWRPPTTFANFTIDDPVLREGIMGLDYRTALEAARTQGFHLTIATVPHDLNLAESTVIQLLRDHPQFLSACYHGDRHDGYEFYHPKTRFLRWRPRPLAEQKRRLDEARTRGDAFARDTGYHLDRVMVFPHGVCPVELLPTLATLGFLGSCNSFDRYPLGAGKPDDPHLGMRPADLAWAGFPLVGRRSLGDPRVVFDLFVGRPSIAFAHRQDVGPTLAPFLERARLIQQLGRGCVHWSGLEEIARHAYLQRREPQHGWEVLMLANEICLHNPAMEPRRFQVHRPYCPEGVGIETDAPAPAAGDTLEVTVAAGSTQVVRLSHPGVQAPAGSRPCSVFANQAQT